MAADAAVCRRETRQLALVLAAVQDSGREHPTAEAIFRRVRERLPQISLGTVYRNLQRLADDGRIAVAHLGARVVRWDPTVRVHDHFLCRRCGRVDDLTAPPPRGAARAAVRAGHRVEAHALVLYGVCRECTWGGRR